MVFCDITRSLISGLTVIAFFSAEVTYVCDDDVYQVECICFRHWLHRMRSLRSRAPALCDLIAYASASCGVTSASYGSSCLI
jgi:hypothetical protein